MLQAIVFDFDGVIADSEPLHLRAYQTILAREGIELTHDDYYGRYLGFDDSGLFRALANDRGLEITDDRVDGWIDAKSAIIEELLSGEPVLRPGAAECVRASAGRCHLASASGAFKPAI